MIEGIMTRGVCYHDVFRIKITPDKVVFIYTSHNGKTKLNVEISL